MKIRPSLLLDLLYPRFCAGCGDHISDGSSHFCWDCFASVSIVKKPFCRICGDPVDGKVEHEYQCSWCQSRAPGYDMARSAARYRGVLKTGLHSYKYGNMTCLTGDLASLLLSCVNVCYRDIDFDAVLCVPLHPSRQKERSYNQAGLLAAKLARDIKVPFFAKGLKRIRPTISQTNLDARKRRKNLKNAFKVEGKRWIEGRKILLVDDVMTTGVTVDECSRVLKKAGAAGVYVVTVARG